MCLPNHLSTSFELPMADLRILQLTTKQTNKAPSNTEIILSLIKQANQLYIRKLPTTYQIWTQKLYWQVTYRKKICQVQVRTTQSWTRSEWSRVKSVAKIRLTDKYDLWITQLQLKIWMSQQKLWTVKGAREATTKPWQGSSGAQPYCQIKTRGRRRSMISTICHIPWGTTAEAAICILQRRDVMRTKVIYLEK